MPLDPKQTVRELKELRDLTGDANGAQRVAWTATWLLAREWFRDKLKSLQVEQHLDAAGNHWTTLAGTSEKTLLLGSHLDSVPNGGWLDGSLGMLASLAVLRTLAEEYRGQPPVTVRMVDWADEEGARFGRSVFGSSAFAGTHNIEADRGKTDRDGIRMEEALRGCGIEMGKIGDARLERKQAAAYLELHIEQGPMLERMGLPLGTVLGTKGVERHKVVFNGQEAHSGTTPMNARRDALAAAAQFMLETRGIARCYPDAVCTVGSVKTWPGIATAVVGRCETTLDQRDLDRQVLAAMHREAMAASHRLAAAEGCSVEWSRIYDIEPVKFHPELITLCDAVIRELAPAAAPHLPSGALHDAAEVSRAGIPSVMLFVQSLGGISHNKIEDTREDYLELSVVALDKLARKAMAWIEHR